MVGIFPVSKRILGIWSFVWFGLFILGIAILGTVCGFNEAINDASDWKLESLKGAANIGLCLTFVILMSISFWDVTLFLRKAGRPLRRIWKSVISEERIGALRSARSRVRWIAFFGIFTMLLVLCETLLFLMKKETTFFGGTVKTAIKDYIKYENNEQWWVIGVASAIFLCGITSALVKLSFSRNWYYCLFSYPNRDMGHLVCSRPGASRLLYIQCAFWTFIISGFICFINFAQTSNQKTTLLSWMKCESKDFSWTSNLYQGVLAGMFLVFVLIVVMLSSHSVKNKRDFEFATRKRNLYTRDLQELIGAKRAINSVDNLHSILVLFWFLGLLSVLLSSTYFSSKINSQNVVKYAATVLTGFTALTVIPLLVSQFSVRDNFDRCNKVDSLNNKRLLRLASRETNVL